MKSNQYTQIDANLALYLFRKKSKRVVVKIFTMILILGICFTIIYPILSLVPVVLSDMKDLGNPNIIWIPLEFSTVSFKTAARFILPSGFWTMLKSILYAAFIMVIQVFFSAMVGYSLARVNFWGRGLVFGMVIFTFLLPRQSLLLAQYINFVHFDVLGIMDIFTDAG